MPFNEFTVGSFWSLKWHRPNYILILRRLFKCLEFSVIFLSYNPLLNPFYSIITLVRVTPVSWLSLTSWPRSICFAPYTSSYKHFKEKYFKNLVESDDKPFLYDAEGKTKFLFHWTQTPTRYVSWPRSSMSSQDKEIFCVLDQLSNRLSTWELVALYDSSKRWTNLSGMWNFFCTRPYSLCWRDV